jgi:hypothetical protein
MMLLDAGASSAESGREAIVSWIRVNRHRHDRDALVTMAAEKHGIAADLARTLIAHVESGGDKLEEAVQRERISRTARRTLDHEDAEADLRLPPERESYTLDSYLKEPKEAKVERIEQLQRAAHKTLLVASYKTGKTTLHANLTRSLTEGSQFLGRFAVKRPKGRVGVWNAEMEGDDYQSYLSQAGVTQTDRVVIWNLRGYRLPLTSDAGAEAAVRWLKDNDVAYWIIDPWARVCAWAGVDENVNAEIGPLLQRVDEIASDAGVTEVLVVHHAGHVKGRPRGATVLPDWADGIWMYTRDEDTDKRYLKAEGRGVALSEGLVEIGEDGRTVYREVSRRAAKVKGLVDEIVAFVAGNPGCTISEAKETLEAGNRAKDEAVSKAIALGMIRKEDDPEDKRRKLLWHLASEPLGGLNV